MQWIKASERLPEGKSHVATIWRVIGHIQPLLIGVYRKDKDGLFLRTPLGGESGRLVWSALEWLDESPPASAVEEAARLYNPGTCSLLFDKKVAEAMQEAHITCARMYTGEIERLKAEAEQSLLLYNNQTATIFKLEAENSKMRNALEWYADAGNYLGDNGELATAWKQNENIKNKAAEAIKSPNV